MHKILSYHLSVQEEPMTTAEKLNRTLKELSEPALREVLDFAEFLKQEKKADETQPGSLAQRIHESFKDLDAENIPIPPRQQDSYFANPKVIEAIERGEEDIRAGRVTKINDPNNIWNSIL